MRLRYRMLGLGAACAVCVIACGSSSSDASSSDVPEACRGIAVDPWKEITIVDEAVVASPRSSNAANGPWSFRHVIESIAPPGSDASAFVAAWLDTYTTSTVVNQFTVPPRLSEPMSTLLLCPWMRARPENACNDTCSACAGRKLDLAYAPFRLIAIVNRGDLRETSADLGGTGEGRLVFGATTGPADDPTSPPLRMTVAFEFHLPASQSAHAWEAQWHALGSHPAFDESYLAELEQVTQGFVAREPDGASTLHQLRTNERVFDWQWDLREFVFDAKSGELSLSATFNTPDKSLNASSVLGNWVKENRAAILKNQHVIPKTMLGGFAQPLERWNVSQADSEIARAFAGQTCDGCHQGFQTPVDINFHLSPLQKGIAKVSPFLSSPDAPDDELRVRARSMRRALCE